MEKKGTEVKREAFLNKAGNLKALHSDQDRNLNQNYVTTSKIGPRATHVLKRASTFNLQSVSPWLDRTGNCNCFQERPCGQRRNGRILYSTGQTVSNRGDEAYVAVLQSELLLSFDSLIGFIKIGMP